MSINALTTATMFILLVVFIAGGPGRDDGTLASLVLLLGVVVTGIISALAVLAKHLFSEDVD